MARRESQGLQITLIVFVMLTIILAVTTIAFWNKSKTLTEQNTSLQTKNTELQGAATSALDQSTQMKVWIGHTADTSIEDIQAQYERDMSTYARSAPEVQRTYKDVPALLFQALQQRNKQATDLREQLKTAQEEFDQTRQQLETARDEALQASAKSEADLLKERDDFAAFRADMNQQKEQLNDQLKKSRNDLASLRTSTDQKIQELERELRNQELIVRQREDQLAQVTEESFETPDGKVLWVNPRTGIAYINLGRADGLRPQVTFSIYGVDVNNVARESSKGSLEVTRVVNDHLAEARITSDEFAEPVLAGDVVYTPLWNAQSALRFAIAGAIDIDDDGKDDRDLIKQLIQVNNGKIDAEDVNGEVVGEVTRNTRYLILGDEPLIGDTGDASATARTNAFSQIIDQADQLGVEILNVQKLMDLIGFDGEKRSIPLGSNARSDDFVPSPGAERGQGSVFRERERVRASRGGN